MISLLCGISNITQMNLSMKQNRIMDTEEQMGGCQGGGARGKDAAGGWG